MQPTLIETERRKRRALTADSRVISPAIKLRVLALLEEGATITEVFRIKGMPSVRSFWRACDTDSEFESRVKRAQVRGAAVKLALASENAEREAESRDPDRMRVAQMLCAVTQVYAEKIAPKEFGQLVKLGGDADMPFAVQVINYAAIEGGKLTPVDSADDGTIAHATQKEIAASFHDDADAAESGEDRSATVVRNVRPSNSRRSVATRDRQKASAKGRNKAS